MTETEITVELLESNESAHNKILSNGFNLIEKVNMIDYYYSKLSMEELLKLDYASLIKNSFLIRKVESKDSCEIKLLFKDKILDDNQNVIAEQKFQCTIGSIENAQKIFNCVNLNCWSQIEQNMSIYHNGTTGFAVQEVANLGTFIEYEEDEDMHELKEYDKIDIMLNRLKNIGLDIGNDYSCKKVLMKFKKDQSK